MAASINEMGKKKELGGNGGEELDKRARRSSAEVWRGQGRDNTTQRLKHDMHQCIRATTVKLERPSVNNVYMKRKKSLQPRPSQFKCFLRRRQPQHPDRRRANHKGEESIMFVLRQHFIIILAWANGLHLQLMDMAGLRRDNAILEEKPRTQQAKEKMELRRQQRPRSSAPRSVRQSRQKESFGAHRQPRCMHLRRARKHKSRTQSSKAKLSLSLDGRAGSIGRRW